MSDNWFFDGNFNLIEDNFFDETKFKPSLNDVNLDQPLTDISLDPSLDAEFEPPPAMFYGDSCNDDLDDTRIVSLRNLTASSGESTCPKENPANGKDANQFRTSSPVSVLESGGSCSGPAEKPSVVDPKLKFLVKRARSKRKRATNFNFRLPFVSTPPATSGGGAFQGSDSDSYLVEQPPKQHHRKRNHLAMLSAYNVAATSDPQQVRKCFHCGVTKTPQWREGPNGPKTLCNACGVRYRSGRLVPEYRPAASPTFVPSMHSNSHRRIVEMRMKAERNGATARA